MDVVTYAALMSEIDALGGHIEEDITEATESWLSEHIDPQTGYAVDNTLSVTGAAADSKTVGDAITAQSAKIDTLEDATVKNIIDLSSASQTTTVNGITFTKSSNGSVTANGTASAAAKYYISGSSYVSPESLGFERNQNYVLSGCPANGSGSTYKLALDGTKTAYNDFGNGVEINITDANTQNYLFVIVIYSGTVCNNLVFTPKCIINRITNAIADATEKIESKLFTAKFLRNSYISNASGISGRIVDAGTWSVYGFDIEPNTTYSFTRYNEFIADSAGNTDKLAYCTYSKNLDTILTSPSTADTYAVDKSDALKGNPDCSGTLSVTPDADAKCLIVATKSGLTNPVVVIKESYAEKTILANRIVYGDVSIETLTQIGGTLSGGVVSLPYSAQPYRIRMNVSECKILRVSCKYTGNSQPYIRVYLNDDTARYYTYYIGSKTEYKETELRIPNINGQINTAEINIIIPSGSSLSFNKFTVVANEKSRNKHGIILESHLGSEYCPNNTMVAFRTAAELGYSWCVCNPRMTADDVIVLCHDNDIASYARNDDGTAISGQVLISQTTYDDLLDYDFGIARGSNFAGERIPTLDEFLMLCAKTNMSPVFSEHYNFSTEEYLLIKEKLISYGLLESLIMKAFSLDYLSTAYSVFGDDIFAYTYDLNSVSDISTTLANLRNSAISSSTLPIYVEIDYLNNSYSTSVIDSIIEAGFRPALYNIALSTNLAYETAIKRGVSKFVDAYNSSNGLVW